MCVERIITEPRQRLKVVDCPATQNFGLVWLTLYQPAYWDLGLSNLVIEPS